MKDTLEFRSVRPDDCEGLAKLFSRLWSWEYPKEYWHHKFFQNPAGEPMSHIALDINTGEIVGCMGGVPLRYRVNGTEGIGTLIVDVGVLPEYRKYRRTYWGVYKLTEADLYHRQVAFVQAVASPAAEIIALKMMHLKPLCYVPVYRRNVTPRALIPHRMRHRFPSSATVSLAGRWMAKQFLRKARVLSERHELVIEKVTQVDDRFNILWSRLEDQWPISLIRDRAFLQWRFLDHPIRRYHLWAAVRDGELLGYCVTDILRREGLARGRISDFLALPDPPGAVEALLCHAMGHLCAAGADMVAGWFLPRHHWEPLLSRIKLRYYGDKRRIIVRIFAAENHRETIFDPKNWYYTGADTDQI